MRRVDSLGSGKVTAASAIVIYTASDIPSDGVIYYHLTMTGAGNTFAGVDRIRVKVDGSPIIDMSPLELRAYIQHQTAGRVRYPAAGAINNLSPAGTAVDWRRFTIPMNFLDQGNYPTMAARDQCQFPRGGNVTIEVVGNSSMVAGLLFVAWTWTDQAPTCYPRLLGSAMNIAASQAVARYSFSEPGIVRALGMPTLGLGNARIVINGDQVANLRGQPATSATVTEDMLFLESQQIEHGASYAVAAGTAAQDNSLESFGLIEISKDTPAGQGSSFVELTTLATNWAGVANELLVYSVVPQ